MSARDLHPRKASCGSCPGNEDRDRDTDAKASSTERLSLRSPDSVLFIFVYKIQL